ncbi:MAG: glycoside hydrolase [Bacteroidetes bacterium GWF2_49_14]|nr:MAG: glycoside hydrolase [Bacteroidetes bacterium GWF2_49_14]HBB93510.1 glycoside hydrolase [Bacteroidales bacterium]
MNRKPFGDIFKLILIVLLSSYAQPDLAGKTDETIRFKGIEFIMPDIHLPVIPPNTVSITDFGAVMGGQVLNTQAFADAIQAVTSKGGGKVVIPAGIWLTGPIILKSNLELHAEAGAMILFSTNKDLYPLINTSFEGLDTWRCMSPIFGDNVENVAFTGIGVWDGAGDAWRPVKKSKLTDSQWKKLIASGGVLNDKKNEWYPSEQFKKASVNADMNVPENLKTKADFESVRDFLRPVMVKIQNSKRILLDGPIFQNSPAWCIHPLLVEDLTVRNITVRNPWYSQNGDGIDFESCRNVLIEHCNFDVGDDAICLKSGKDEDGRRRGVPCENMVIRNNIVYHGHGGVTIGSEMSGGVRNIHISGCTFMGTDVGLRFKSNRSRGGVVENIFISDIRMTDIPTMAISFDLYYGGMSVSEQIESGKSVGQPARDPVTEKTPRFKDISMRNITVKGALQAVFLQGLPEMKLENIHLSDMLLEAENGFSITDTDHLVIENVQLKTKNETSFEFYNCKDVVLKKTEFNSEANTAIKVNGSECDNISLQSSGDKRLNTRTIIGKEVLAGVVRF